MTMRPTRRRLVAVKWVAALATLAALVLTEQAMAAPQRTALRVCADPHSMPFSNKQRQGFENKIAELFGKSLGIPVKFTWFPQRFNFVQHTLRDKDPQTGRYKCDLIMGVPTEFDMGTATKPYYCSTYALVYRQGAGLDGIKTEQQFLNLPTATRKKLRIGVFDATPAAEWLGNHGMRLQMEGYPILSADPDQTPGQIMQNDLEHGKIDAVIIWGPIAGYFVNRDIQHNLAMVPLHSEKGIRFEYAISMGVRWGDKAWKNQVEKLIAQNTDQIKQILHDYHVPLLPISSCKVFRKSDDD